MNVVRECLNCGFVEDKVFACPQCGHPENFHACKDGHCEKTCENGEPCPCVRPDIELEMKAISFYNDASDHWMTPFVVKCHCDNPQWSEITTFDRDLKFKIRTGVLT